MGQVKPTFGKVDKNTIRITVEKTDEVPLYFIEQNKKQLEKQREEVISQSKTQLAQIDQALKNIQEILDNAKKMNIVAKKPEPPKAPKKQG